MESENQTTACHWRLDDPDRGIWETGCGHAFQFTADGPRENGARFCCYCGKRLEEINDGQ